MKATPISPSAARGGHVAVGLILFVAGIVCNQRTLAIFADDGQIASTKYLAVIWALQLLCIVTGVCIIIFRGRLPANSLIIKIFSSLVFSGFTLVLSAVLLFGIFEAFPSLLPASISNSHSYYVMKSRYLFDAELGYRFKPHHYLEKIYFGDLYLPNMEFKPEPITVRISHDKNGHHNPEVPVRPEIVVLGDSWLWIGHDWQDTFAARLEAKSGYVTYNLGVTGYGPHQYLITFKRYAADLNPSVVIFCFFEGNDMLNTENYLSWKESGSSRGLLGDVARMSQGNSFERFLERFGRAGAGTLKLVRRYSMAPPENLVVELNLADKTLPAAINRRGDPRPPDELLESREWRELEKILVEFKRASVGAGALPILVFLPSKSHIYARHTRSDTPPDHRTLRERELASENHREAAFTSLAKKLNIDLISLTPTFESKAAAGTLLYYPFDSHWNSTARGLAADVLAKELSRMRESGRLGN